MRSSAAFSFFFKFFHSQLDRSAQDQELFPEEKLADFRIKVPSNQVKPCTSLLRSIKIVSPHLQKSSENFDA